MPVTSRRQATRLRRRHQRIILTLGSVASLLFAGMFILTPMLTSGTGMSDTTIRMSRTVGGTTRFVEATGAASRSETREPISSATDSNDGTWGETETLDTDTLTRRHADNPMIRILINGRDDASIPDGYDPDHATGDTGNAYPYGQCTWWAYKRRHELGLPTGSRFGNARDWPANARSLGYWTDSTPRRYAAVVFQPGQEGADPAYGHVAIVEQVHKDGSITISEANVNGQVGPFQRDLDAAAAKTLEYIHY
ncbi:CHAP domain-containing protein [Bifidobacterium sp. SO1]|nr:CHAP domain-containing protein [Bifidobacterium sp. SO1]